jgi:tetratricopeptide (TPR) repeat protein
MSTPTLAQFEYEIGARMRGGDFIGAGAAAAACRAAWPSAPSGWLLGSFAALCEGKADIALELIEECLTHDPGDVQFLLQQAECLMALGRKSDAIAIAAALGGSPRAQGAAFDVLGEFLINAREYGEALKVYDRAAAAAPRSIPVLARRAALHRLLGHFDLAGRDYEMVLTLSPGHPDALKALVDLERQSPERNHLDTLNAALAGAPTESIDAAVLHFALAKSHEDLGDHATSWRHLVIANRLERARNDYEPANDRAAFERIMAGFPDIEPVYPDITHERPIFIVGLPRTGMTLVERIVGSHSRVAAAGELPALSQAITRAFSRTPQGQPRNWQEFAARVGGLDAETIAQAYLALSLPQRGDRARFADTHPLNFFYCALILRAFPHAHIVHLERHPLATCHAIYKTRFDAGVPFAYDLDELGDFYVGYHRLMRHWRRVLPGRIFDIAYEDLVSSQEATTRRLLDYLELPFEPACLEFHLNPAPTHGTASAVQVRRPLYESSLELWRHYSQELAPLRARLEAAGIAMDLRERA